MKIGIYGGAFNPIHFGHLKTAEDILSKLSLDSVVFIPAGIPPFNKPGLADAEHRFRMVEAAIEGRPDLEVSDIELQSEGRSYTIDTIEKIKNEGTELFLIIGADAFKDIQLWKEPDRILSMVHVVVISRPGYSFAGISSSPYLSGVSKDVFQTLDSGDMQEFTVTSSNHMDITLLRVLDVDISSSHVREAIISGKDTQGLLPESVKSYIIFHNLYEKNNNQE